jgi:hypothetical protein
MSETPTLSVAKTDSDRSQVNQRSRGIPRCWAVWPTRPNGPRPPIVQPRALIGKATYGAAPHRACSARFTTVRASAVRLQPSLRPAPTRPYRSEPPPTALQLPQPTVPLRVRPELPSGCRPDYRSAGAYC